MVLQASSGRVGHTIFDGTYEIHAAVGRGRNSVVYKARKLHGRGEGEFVALKVLLGNGKEPATNVKRMKREALAMLACRSPYVVRLNDFVTHDDLCYLSMEYCDGGDLRMFLEQLGGPLAPPDAFRFANQVLEGLEIIHRSGVLHRDIKPENLLLAHDGTLKIADFGVALLPIESVSLRDAGAGVGTFDYLAPEALEQGEADHRADLYSVGVTLYQLLTGRLPFEADSISRQIQQKLAGGLSLDVPGVEPRALEELFRRALATKPGDRFQSAEEFREAIRQTEQTQHVSLGAPRKPLHNQDEPRLSSLDASFQPDAASDSLLREEILRPRQPAPDPTPTWDSPEAEAAYTPPGGWGQAQGAVDARKAAFGSLDEEELPEVSSGAVPRLGSVEGHERRRRSMRGKLLLLLVLGAASAAGVAAFRHTLFTDEQRAEIESMISPWIERITKRTGGGDAVEQPSAERAPADRREIESGEKSGTERASLTDPNLLPEDRDAEDAAGASAREKPENSAVAPSPGEKVGTLEHLFATGKGVEFTISSLATLGRKDRAIVTLKLYGWEPVEIAVADLAAGHDLEIAGSGILLTLHVADAATDGTYSGTYVEKGSGRQGSWKLRSF